MQNLRVFFFFFFGTPNIYWSCSYRFHMDVPWTPETQLSQDWPQNVCLLNPLSIFSTINPFFYVSSFETSLDPTAISFSQRSWLLFGILPFCLHISLTISSLSSNIHFLSCKQSPSPKYCFLQDRPQKCYLLVGCHVVMIKILQWFP